MAEFGGGLEYLLHQPAGQRAQALVSENDIGGDAARGDGQAVERHIPDELFPTHLF